jgi:dephospho-CoA kinase
LSLVLGVTGPNAAGKGEVTARLAARGFTVHSLSDIVREEAAARGFPPEREHLIRIGTELRRAGGAGVLAERLLPRLRGREAVDSIRNPAEVEVLRRLPRFVLVGVRAKAEVRFARSRSRARPGDPETFEAFLERERQENRSDPAGQQLDATFRLADRILDNDGDLDHLREGVDRLLDALEGETASR